MNLQYLPPVSLTLYLLDLTLTSLQPPEEAEDKLPEGEDLLGVERTPSGRIRRTSAQVAVFHLQEIAEDELAREWTKRRMKDDLVPETARVSHQAECVSYIAQFPLDVPHLQGLSCGHAPVRGQPCSATQHLHYADPYAYWIHLPFQLNYTRPGLPTLSPELIEAWKSQVKDRGHVNCPNDVSGWLASGTIPGSS